MLGLFASWLTLSVVFLAASKALPAVKVKSFPWALKAAAIFGVANLLVGWLLSLIITIIISVPAFFTLGLAYLVGPIIVNMILLKITDEVIEEEFEIEEVGALVKFSLLLAVTDFITHMIWG